MFDGSRPTTSSWTAQSTTVANGQVRMSHARDAAVLVAHSSPVVAAGVMAIESRIDKAVHWADPAGNRGCLALSR